MKYIKHTDMEYTKHTERRKEVNHTGCGKYGKCAKKTAVLAAAIGLTLLLFALAGCHKNSSADRSADGDESAAIEELDFLAYDTELSGSGESLRASKNIFAMDTYMTLTACGECAEDAIEAAADEVGRLNAMLSVGNPESEVAKVNANGGGTLSEDTAYLLERSEEIYESTNGCFDIAIYPLMKAWGFTDENYRVPSEETIKELLPLTDASNIIYDKESGELSFGVEGMEIDFGGIAKGYTSSRIMEIFRECGVSSGLVNLGGNVEALGTKIDGSDWRVAIQDPEDTSDYMGIISVEDEAVITSGGYQRYFEKDGKRYIHIMDPDTGYPADTGLLSVTIVSGDGTLSDGLSTSLFIMGKNEAISYWREHADEFDMLIMDDERGLYVSEGISARFESELEYEVILLNP